MKKVCTDYNGKQYFKCLESDTYYSIEAALPGWSKFSKLCENDPKFYQVCGAGHDENFEINDKVLCGYYICQEANGIFTSSYMADSSYSCDSKKQCANTDLDEADCKGSTIGTISSSNVCDGYCDLKYCQDESVCNGYRYGYFCENHYYPPNLIGVKVYENNASLSKMTCGDDENITADYHLCNYFNHNLMRLDGDPYIVHLYNFTRCGAFRFKQAAIDKGFWLKSRTERSKA